MSFPCHSPPVHPFRLSFCPCGPSLSLTVWTAATRCMVRIVRREAGTGWTGTQVLTLQLFTLISGPKASTQDGTHWQQTTLILRVKNSAPDPLVVADPCLIAPHVVLFLGSLPLAGHGTRRSRSVPYGHSRLRRVDNENNHYLRGIFGLPSYHIPLHVRK